MKLLSSLKVGGDTRRHEIQLLQGDLTDIPPEHAVDVLVVSAFPYEYSPTKRSLIGALNRKGVSVRALAQRPAANLRANFGCWLSKPIEASIEGLSFKQILCFEPAIRGRAPEVVGDIFRALAPFVHGPPHVRSIALPIVATGSQRHPLSKMLPALLEAAYHHLEAGLPIDVIKIVVVSDADAQEATALFERPAIHATARKSISIFQRLLQTLGLRQALTPPPKGGYDVFVSYSRRDKDAAIHVSRTLTDAGASVFMDETAIEIGSSWQQSIWQALEGCARTVALYSPDFVSSKVCQDEFNAAMILRRRRGENFIFPILVRSAELPAYMEMLNYQDCCVSDKNKLSHAAKVLAAQISASRPQDKQ